ncbi:DUF6285 domain-containing protein [Phenylobacterium sp.]|jgi:uncharacterized protein YcbX|uniref:DUF6285 domain-containing protein n=1 Tax=Phenylobacterium sp. TaxID=1871053 RepID=UPI002E300B8D|nr:DUF6285 domain-containing protein [Phenylobacterium sp.]HEX2561298.1 DUF6285 domain-containing protein [Phenylobacterium sp.]
MTTHPTAGELVAAVSAFLERLTPTLAPREAFMARVAQNALGIVWRELAQGPTAEAAAAARLSDLLGREGSLEALTSDLCRALRDGELDAASPGLLEALKANTLAQLAIDQPDYRWRAEGAPTRSSAQEST